MSTRVVVSTADAPSAIGPYSQAVKAGGFVFCSGQIALDPATGALVDGDAAAETRQVMSNLGAVLRAAGATFGDVVRCSIFLADMADFAAVNEVYGSYFDEAPPARATVAVRELPKSVRVEIACTALCP